MSKGLGQVISWYFSTVIAFFFLVARLWIRFRKLGALGIDDGLIVLSMCCLIGDLVIQQHMWNLGMADIATASREDFIQIMKMIVPGSILYVSSLWAIKFALVLFYKRIAAPGTTLQTIYNVALGVLAASWTTIFFHIIFQCYPHDKRWSKDPTYQCDPANSDINYWLTIILNISTDVAIISLPISMVLQLQMKPKQKLGVSAIFALGILVVIASIIRAYYSKRHETMLTCTVSMIETAVAIIASCLPPLRSLIVGMRSTAGNSSNYGHYELSSAGVDRSRRTHQSRITTNIVSQTNKGNDSEDELVRGAGRSAASSGGFLGESKHSGIRVKTTFQMHGSHGLDEGARTNAEYNHPT
ncbi:hypothetical protein B0T10DRAFT_539314 [Thelonectria olida]|uniref:Rhodopsin domain-containing protein n=1 Tax=Thelonectria olida TaxID=1576542 RepID=A0A9P9AME2_9HYPO|nr:hypothetical protein B0T10DRAFT_539314 [Thelonectria olida]